MFHLIYIHDKQHTASTRRTRERSVWSYFTSILLEPTDIINELVVSEFDGVKEHELIALKFIILYVSRIEHMYTREDPLPVEKKTGEWSYIGIENIRNISATII